MSRTHLATLVLALASPLAIHACTAHHTRDAAVEAAISSVTLGEGCHDDDARLGAPPPAASDAGVGFAPELCDAEGGCGGYCRRTTVQLAINSDEHDLSVPFEVVSIRLRTMGGAVVDTLDPRRVHRFDGERYVEWDQRVAPGESLQVSYETSSPDWIAIGGGNSRSTYGMSFRVEMVVLVDGVERTLSFSPASREPEVVT